MKEEIAHDGSMEAPTVWRWSLDEVLRVENRLEGAAEGGGSRGSRAGRLQVGDAP